MILPTVVFLPETTVLAIGSTILIRDGASPSSLEVLFDSTAQHCPTPHALHLFALVELLILVDDVIV